MIAYYGITQIILNIMNVTLSSYGGADSVGIKMIKDSLLGIKDTYLEFYDYYFTDKIVKNTYWNRNYINFALFLITGVSLLAIILKKKEKKSYKIILLIVGLALLPIAVNIIRVITPQRSINLLMSMPLVIPILFCITLLEYLDKTILDKLVKWGIVAITSMLLWTYILSTNASYKVLQIVYNQNYSVMMRVMARAEAIEEYSEDIHWLFIGIPKSTVNKRTAQVFKMENGLLANGSIFSSIYEGNRNSIKQFLSDQLGITIQYATDGEYNKIIESEEFEKMGIFPEKNSVQIINGVMVIKFSNTPLSRESW